MKEGVEVECYIPGLEEKLKKFISSSILCIISDKKTSNKEEEVMPFPKMIGHSVLIGHVEPMMAAGKAHCHICVLIYTYIYIYRLI
jgi:hypothetical protein